MGIVNVFDNKWPIMPEDCFDDRWKFAMQVASLETNHPADLELIHRVFVRVEHELSGVRMDVLD